MMSKSHTWVTDVPEGVMGALAGSLALTGVFWTSNMTLQRAAGLLSMHSGRAYPVTVLWGLCSTTICLLFTQYNTHIIVKTASVQLPKILNDMGITKNYSLNFDVRSVQSTTSVPFGRASRNASSEDKHSDVKQAVLGLSIFTLLERRAFRTSIPSTLISTGVYAHTPVHWHRSLPSILKATSEVASAAQRAIIQSLGRMHGCHHCGSRQLGKSTYFIADHMPPTKQIREMNAAWYRRMLGISAKQQLLPQCQKCYSRQVS